MPFFFLSLCCLFQVQLTMATEDQQPGEEMEVYSSDDDYSIMTEEQWIQYEKEVEESQVGK